MTMCRDCTERSLRKRRRRLKTRSSVAAGDRRAPDNPVAVVLSSNLLSVYAAADRNHGVLLMFSAGANSADRLQGVVVLVRLLLPLVSLSVDSRCQWVAPAAAAAAASAIWRADQTARRQFRQHCCCSVPAFSK